MFTIGGENIKDRISDNLKPSDKLKGYPIKANKFLIRFFEIIPGFIDFLLIFSPIVVFFNFYYASLIFINLIGVFWIYSAFKYIYGICKGVKYYERDLKVDWIKLIVDKYNSEYKKLNYVLIYPIFNEKLETIESAISGWVNSEINTTKISLVVALEEKYSEKAIESFNIIKEKYEKKLKEVIIVVHPDNIEGEVKGVKSANINYATREFSRIVKSRGENLKDYLLFSFDSDFVPHRKYISAITYKFLSQENPYNKYYTSAVHTFNNNLYRVSILSRLYSMGLTLTVLHHWALKKWHWISPDSWSSYAISLKTIDDVGYWYPDVENDDTFLFWNSTLYFNGDFKGVEVYIPTYNDAVEGKSAIETYKRLYKQQYRWGWGIVTFPITLVGIYYNSKIGFKESVLIIIDLFINQILNRVATFLIVFGLPIVNVLHYYLIDKVSLGFIDFIMHLVLIFVPILNLFTGTMGFGFHPVIGFLLIFIFFLNFPIVYVRRKIMPIPVGWGIKENVYDYLSVFLIVVNLLTFSLVPYVFARIKLMLGRRPKNFSCTKKF